jgi:hypothetical protein
MNQKRFHLGLWAFSALCRLMAVLSLAGLLWLLWQLSPGISATAGLFIACVCLSIASPRN